MVPFLLRGSIKAPIPADNPLFAADESVPHVQCKDMWVCLQTISDIEAIMLNAKS